jgi:hypothetical protein
MVLSLQNSFEDRECTHYLLLNFDPFLPVGRELSRFSQNSFEKRQLVTCCFSKEFCANLRDVSTKRITGIAHCCPQQSSASSKALVLRDQELIDSNKILLGELNKY